MEIEIRGFKGLKIEMRKRGLIPLITFVIKGNWKG